MAHVYDQEFYKMQAEGSYISAKTVIGVFKNKLFTPNSVFDVGCGVGTWLKAWREAGVPEIAGVDGNEIGDEFLYVPREQIRVADLDDMVSQFDGTIGGKKFDLVTSLEVGEHLKPESSEKFIRFLTGHADVVLFSAALPLQGGENHINCQPLQFWVDLFARNGFECYDTIRPALIAGGGAKNCDLVSSEYPRVRKTKGRQTPDAGSSGKTCAILSRQFC
jgi:SAM-dependent methyltransferase